MCIEPISWTLALKGQTSLCNNYEQNRWKNCRIPLSVTTKMDEDSRMVNELTLLVSNIKDEVFVKFFIYFYFFEKTWKIKSHNMFLMLDPRFLNLRLVSSLIGQKQRISIVHE
jgi:hypothetical protein